MKSDRPNSSQKDYGRRGYIESDPKSHMDRMRRVTDFQKYHEALEKHSEWKRPYLSDDYPEMEYWWSPPFIMNPKWWLPYYTPDVPVGPDFFDPTKECVACAISCQGGSTCDFWGWCHMSVACWLPGQNISRDFSWEIVEQDPADGIVEVEYDKPLSGCIRFKTDVYHVDKNNEVYVKVKYTDGAGNICFDDVVLHCKKDCCLPDPPPFEWDENSDDTILRNDTAVVTVISGCLPYSWSITGTGFSLDYAETDVRSNIVRTDNTACGSANITVTDLCGTTTSGSVRCTQAGYWQQKDTSCHIRGNGECVYPWSPSCNPTVSTGYILELVKGKGRQLHTQKSKCNRSAMNPEPCEAGAYDFCHDVHPCMECVTQSPWEYLRLCTYYAAWIPGWNCCFCTVRFYYYEWEC